MLQDFFDRIFYIRDIVDTEQVSEDRFIDVVTAAFPGMIWGPHKVKGLAGYPPDSVVFYVHLKLTPPVYGLRCSKGIIVNWCRGKPVSITPYD
jgi:hypothetical protein